MMHYGIFGDEMTKGKSVLGGLVGGFLLLLGFALLAAALVFKFSFFPSIVKDSVHKVLFHLIFNIASFIS